MDTVTIFSQVIDDNEYRIKSVAKLRAPAALPSIMQIPAGNNVNQSIISP